MVLEDFLQVGSCSGSSVVSNARTLLTFDRLSAQELSADQTVNGESMMHPAEKRGVIAPGERGRIGKVAEQIF
jgi:hypothetical protein